MVIPALSSEAFGLSRKKSDREMKEKVNGDAEGIRKAPRL